MTETSIPLTTRAFAFLPSPAGRSAYIAFLGRPSPAVTKYGHASYHAGEWGIMG